MQEDVAEHMARAAIRAFLLRADLFCGVVAEQLLVCGLGGMCWACHQLVSHGVSPG